MLRKLGLLMTVTVVVAGVAGLAHGQSVTRVTGGGQILTGSEDAAEDTLTFEVQQTDSGMTFGEVEYDPTDSQEGSVIAGTRFHGRVTCLEVAGNTALFAGVKDARSSGPTQGTSFFKIQLEDTQPEGTSGDDAILFNRNDDDGQCDDEAFSQDTRLFRGEAQITENGGP